MRTPDNAFKAAIAEPGARLGLWLGLADPYSAELCATAGFDWLLVDGEHGPNDLRSMLSVLQAVAPYPAHPVVRIPTGDATLIKQVLEIGATTLLVPMVETAEQARALVAATRYPPRGIRGVGSGLARSSRWNGWPESLHEADERVCLLVQVETASAMARLDEIAAVDGVDGVFVGPSDLAASMGHLGRPGHPEVRAEIERAIPKILAAGKAPGILAVEEGLARRSIELGARFVAVGVETTILARGARELSARFRGAAAPAPRPAGYCDPPRTPMTPSPALHVAGVEISPDHYIGGARVASPETFEVHRPIDGERLGRIAMGLPQHVEAAIVAAQRAFPAWSALGAAGRKPYLDRFAEEIGRRADAFCTTESNDAGVLLSRMRHGVVPRAMLNVSWFAEHALRLQDRRIETEQATHLVRHDPAGVVVVITPWNAPLMLSTWKLGPALAAGDTCILKPPEWAPLTCSLLADAAHAAGLPPGVLNVVQGIGSTTGAALVSDPRIARVSFTGSVPTARTIARAAGGNLVPCSLELGGKSPFIVLEDADIDGAAATGALMYRNAGQVCLAGTRLLVHERIAARFVDAMRGHVERLRVGDPRDEATEVGPIIHPRQVERVAGFVERAVASGARVLWGGARHPFGAQYYAPTMLTDVAQDSEIVQNEVFGPVLTLQTFASDDEAVALANGTDYGLGGVCYGETAHATAIAERVRTGFIWVNSFGIRDLAAPFGGIKRSGVGREGGDWSFEFFCDVKDVVVPKKPFKASFSHR